MTSVLGGDWKTNKWFWYAVTGLLFAGLLYLADIGEFIAALRQVDPAPFAVAVAVGFSSLFVWAWVWHRFFGQLSIQSTTSRTLRMFLTGQFLNSITPLGQFGGEPVMAYIVSETTGADYERSLASVVSSDIINAVPFFTLTLGGIAYLAAFGTLEEFFVEVGAVAAFVLAVGGGVAYLLWSANGALGARLVGLIDWIEAVVGRGEGVFDSIRGSIHEVVEAFETAGSNPRFLLWTAIVSHLAIVAQIVSLYFVFRAMGIVPQFIPIYFLVTLSTIATLSPTPGGSGTYEAAFSALMGIFYAVDLATALTAAVLFRLTTYWPGLVVGYLSLFTLRTDREEITEELD